MPWNSTSDLPAKVKDKYKGDATAQRAFLNAFNSCWDSHEGDEGRCWATGYAAANQSEAKTDRGKKGSLRSRVIRLAHERPDLRRHLLSALKTAGDDWS